MHFCHGLADVIEIGIHAIAGTRAVVHIAVAADGRQVGGFVEILAGERIEIACRPGGDPGEAGQHLGCGCFDAIVAHHADAATAMRVLVGVAADNVVSTDTAFIDIAHEIHEVVVADITPAAGDGVVVVNGADFGEWIAEVGCIRVVDDDVLHFLIVRNPLAGAALGTAIGEVGTPFLAGDDGWPVQ